MTPGARDLLDAAADGDDPSAADARRVRSKIATRIGVGAAAAGTATAGTKAAVAGKAAIGLAAKLALGLALAGTGVVALVLAERPATVNPAARALAPVIAHASAAPDVVPTDVTTPTTEARVEPAPPPVRRPAPVEHRRTAPSSVAPSPPPPPAVDAVTEEARLLRDAERALARNDAVTALARVDEHAARFPHGVLAEERQATRVFTLCALGFRDEARAAASSFLAASARSPLAGRVDRTCR